MTIQITSAPSARKRDTGRRELAEARRARDIIDLLDRHDELRGVYAMADMIDDAVRWTA
jgi:hypothetical protein